MTKLFVFEVFIDNAFSNKIAQPHFYTVNRYFQREICLQGKYKDIGRQIRRKVILFFFPKHSWSSKINTVGKYVLIKEEIQIGSLVYTNLNSFTNVFKQEKRYDATAQET